MYASNYGLDVRVVRAVNIYGPGDPNDSRLIPKTAQRLLRGEAPLLHAGAADMRRRDEWLAQAIGRALSPVERDLVVLAASLLERLADDNPYDVSD